MRLAHKAMRRRTTLTSTLLLNLASAALALSCFAYTHVAHAQKVPPSTAASCLAISPGEIDDTVARAIQVFQVPGTAVGIVKDGKLIFAKGYGVREVGKPGRVDTNTPFQIGSNTKAFTTATSSTTATCSTWSPANSFRP